MLSHDRPHGAWGAGGWRSCAGALAITMVVVAQGSGVAAGTATRAPVTQSAVSSKTPSPHATEPTSTISSATDPCTGGRGR
jgi:hypothetical protein